MSLNKKISNIINLINITLFIGYADFLIFYSRNNRNTSQSENFVLIFL